MVQYGKAADPDGRSNRELDARMAELEADRRARFTATACTLLGAVALLAFGVRAWKGEWSIALPPIAILIACAAGLELCRRGRTAFAGHLLMAATVGTPAAVLWLTSGHLPTPFFVVALVPLMAVLVTGPRWGALWGGAALVATTIGTLPSVLGGNPIVDIDAARIAFAWSVLPMALVAIVLATALLHDWHHRRGLRELIELQAQAGSAEHARGNFLARMSHEFRTPLNGVIGLADLLRDTPLRADQQEMLSLIRDAGFQLLDVVNDVLDYSKLAGGKIVLRESSVAPAGLLRHLREPFALRAQARGIELDVHIDEALPPMIVADVRRLRHVLANLVSNAVEFTSSGRVILSADLLPPVDTQPIDARPTDTQPIEGVHRLRFSVRDTGMGIAAEALPHLFEPFFQVDTSPSRSVGGTGLGLSICRELVQLMGSELRVESTVGEGSVFWFDLDAPAAPSNHPVTTRHAEVEIVAPRRPLPRDRGRILVAEDNPVNRSVVEAIVTRLGFDIDLAVDGREAIELAREQRYHCILMDCHMPSVDGFEATRQIRADEIADGRRAVPIVAVTASVLAEDRLQCAEAGMNGFCAKPFTADQLARALHESAGSPAVPFVESAAAG